MSTLSTTNFSIFWTRMELIGLQPPRQQMSQAQLTNTLNHPKTICSDPMSAASTKGERMHRRAFPSPPQPLQPSQDKCCCSKAVSCRSGLEVTALHSAVQCGAAPRVDGQHPCHLTWVPAGQMPFEPAAHLYSIF